MLNTLNPVLISKQGPHEFRRLIQRFFLHLGEEVFSIDGPGDRGADLILINSVNIKTVFQIKWKKNIGQSPSRNIINELKEALYEYSAHKSIAITNTNFTLEVQNYCSKDNYLEAWNLQTINSIAINSNGKFKYKMVSSPLREYQKKAYKRVIKDLYSKKKSLLYLATGLGKTKVATKIIKIYLRKNKNIKILILAHMNDLLEQLQKSVWREIDFKVQTQLVNSLNKPQDLNGITFASDKSIIPYFENGYEPDLIIIDECHHVGFDNNYSEIIRMNPKTPLLGVTATPWRGDKYNIEEIFGEPSFSCNLTEGMKLGYLAPINYKLFQDNINWDAIPEMSENSYSIRELNKKLFIPQRDSKILDELNQTWKNVYNPKCIIFCQSIEHCNQLIKEVKKFKQWENSTILHSKLSKFDRVQSLINFQQEKCNLLLAVDILNEGIDVPNVNIICFARVTHSRKIFIQQLGRGLRIYKNKEFVVVLDFVADVRRLAAISDIEAKIGSSNSEILSKEINTIDFKDMKAEGFINEWIKDISDLEDYKDEARLNFPHYLDNQ